MDTGSAVEVARERTVQALCHHYAHDRLTIEELDRRLADAQRAPSVAALDALLADLPALSPHPVAAADGLVPAPSVLPAPQAEGRIATIMGETKRTGTWTVPATLRVVAVLADVTLDMSEARIGAATEIDCSAWMSSVRILVPPGVRLETAGGTFMGSFTEKWRQDDALPSDAPFVRITGLAAMSEVTVKVAAPKPPRGVTRWFGR